MLRMSSSLEQVNVIVGLALRIQVYWERKRGREVTSPARMSEVARASSAAESVRAWRGH